MKRRQHLSTEWMQGWGGEQMSSSPSQFCKVRECDLPHVPCVTYEIHTR